MKLELHGIEKEFHTLRGRVAAVAGIDLTVEDGEFFVLLGPSGSGKSTLLNLIAGLERPSGGELRFDKKLVAAPRRRLFLPPRERGVAMVFQSYALYPHLDVFGNIAFPLKIARFKSNEIREAVQQAADTLDITELLPARPGELSGGQRQRVAIARAIVRRPKVLLLDEPLSNLDMQLRTSTRAELKRLQRELAVTTVYVTHDQTEAMTLGDRIAVLRRGRLEQIGTAEELYRDPANAFVGGFVGVPPMNILPARLEQRGKEAILHLGPCRQSLSPGVAARAFGADLCGLRPEHIQIREVGDDGIKGTIETVEPMGRETLLHLRVGEETLRVLTHDGRHRPEEEVSLRIDPEQLHFFREKEKP